MTTIPNTSSSTFTFWRRVRRILLLLSIVATATSAWLVMSTARIRFARDVARLVFNDNTEALEQAQLGAGTASDSLRHAIAALPEIPPRDQPVIIISIADHRLWYKLADSVLFTAPVATGSGRQLIIKGTSRVLRFETPRGRFLVDEVQEFGSKQTQRGKPQAEGLTHLGEISAGSGNHQSLPIAGSRRAQGPGRGP